MRRPNTRRMRLARERAPKHPPKPEAEIRGAIERLLTAMHSRIRASVLEAAPGYAARKRRRPPVRKDAAGLIGYASLLSTLRSMAASCGAAVSEVGETAVGPILALELPGDPCIVIVTGQHGEEQAGPLMIAECGGDLFARARQLGLGLRIYPCVNPEGFERGKRRDLDGNTHANSFIDYLVDGHWKGELAPGESAMGMRRPRQAPETVALYDDLASWMSTHLTAAVLDLHQDSILDAGEAFAYVFGDRQRRETWARILARAGEPLRNAKLENGSWSAIKLQTDSDGLTILRDGSLPDWADRADVPWSACLETPLLDVDPAAGAIGFRFVAGCMDLIAGGAWRRDAADHPLAGDNRDPLLHSVFFSLWHQLQVQLHTSPFRRIVDGAAKATAKSVNKQTAAALDDPEHDPDLDTDAFAPDAVDKMEGLAADSLERAEDALNQWAEEDGEDEDALAEDLESAMAGATGKGLAWAGLAFGALFAGLVIASQKAGGVGSAIWLISMDFHVRPAHAELDGVEFTWDDPPLKAEKASNDEDDFPGEDYNCRCVSSPVTDDEGEDEESDDS